MLIRRETSEDIPAVAAVTAAAFATENNPDPVERWLLGELRADEGWLDALSLVALEPSGDVVGHVVCTRGRVGDLRAVGLGPLSVHPDHQGHGVGSALMHAVLGAADALREPFVALLGEPDYYRRFGFRPGEEAGVLPPDPTWGSYFQIRELAGFRPGTRGTFTYAEPFSRL